MKAFQRKEEKLTQRVNDVLSIIRVTKEQMKKYLMDINSSQEVVYSLFEVFRLFFKKEKCLYQSLNKLQGERNLLNGYMWSHLAKHQLLNELFEYQQRLSGNEMGGLG